jgi:hypothetical protein
MHEAPFVLAVSDRFPRQMPATFRLAALSVRLAIVSVAVLPVAAPAQTNVTGTISQSTTWTLAGSPYVVTGWVHVRGAASPVLTIEPGVEVRFRQYEGMSIGSATSPGGLVAVGTPDQPIRFTSNAASVAAGYWRRIELNQATAAGTRIENAIVEGAGYDWDGAVVIRGGAPVLASVTLQKNRAAGVRVEGGTPTMTGCVLRDTTGVGVGVGLGLDVRGGTVTLRDTTITGNAGAAMALFLGGVLEGLTGLTISGNAGGDVVQYRSTQISANERWKSFGVPYVLTDGWVHVRGAASPVLTIEPGVEVRFRQYEGMSIGSATSPGGLVAVGTPDQPIRFTSNAASVAAGYWRRIELNQATAEGTRIENAIVEGAGYDWDGAVVIRGGAPVLASVTLQKNRAAGVRVEGGTPTMTGCVLRDTTGVGVGVGLGLDVRGGTVTLRDTTITGNAGAAMALFLGGVLEGLTGLTISGNAGGDVVQYRSTQISANERWKSFGVPYVLTDGWVHVRGAASPVLTIEPGVEVRFRQYEGMSIGSATSPGGLVAVGTPDQPIRFTSNAASVAAGYWRRIELNQATAEGTRIENAIVEGAGYDWDGAVVIRGGAPVLASVTLQKNRAAGVRVEGGTPTMTGCVLRDTTGVGVGVGLGLDVRGGTVTLRDTTITGNAGAAMALFLGGVLEGLTGLTISGNAGGDVVQYRSTQISANERWKSFGVPYVLTDGWVHVRGAASPVLTIEPGVEVRFRQYEGMSIGSATSPGGLVAVGTPDQPIRFTSNAASVAAGYWRRIELNQATAEGTRIENAIVEGAGYDWDGAVVIRGGAPVLASVTLQKNRAAGVRVEGGTPTMTGCVLRDTTGVGVGVGLGLDVRGGTVTLRDTTITGNAGAAMALFLGGVLEGLTGLTISGNAGGDVVQYRSTQISANERWKSFGVPYVLTDGWVHVRGAASPVLTIEPGVEVRFTQYEGMSIGDASSPGGLVAVGTPDQPIRFTSNAASVAAGYWRRISLNQATAAGTRIENAIVEGAGYDWDGAVVIRGGAPVLGSVTFQKNRAAGVRVEGGAPTIAGCTIRDGSDRGLWLLGGSLARVIGNTVTGNTGVGIQNESSRATIRLNTISGNGSYGILSVNGALGARDNSVTSNGGPARNNDTASRTLDLRQQWWGAETPPAGLVGRVEHDPWLGSPPTPLFAVVSFERSTAAFNPDGAGVTFAFELPRAGHLDADADRRQWDSGEVVRRKRHGRIRRLGRPRRGRRAAPERDLRLSADGGGGVLRDRRRPAPRQGRPRPDAPARARDRSAVRKRDRLARRDSGNGRRDRLRLLQARVRLR